MVVKKTVVTLTIVFCVKQGCFRIYTKLAILSLCKRKQNFAHLMYHNSIVCVDMTSKLPCWRSDDTFGTFLLRNDSIQ